MNLIFESENKTVDENDEAIIQHIRIIVDCDAGITTFVIANTYNAETEKMATYTSEFDVMGDVSLDKYAAFFNAAVKLTC